MAFLWILSLSAGLLTLLPTAESEKIRLVGPSRCAGRVEINHQDIWGTVCDDHWSMTNAEVLCRELNCGAPLEAKTNAFFGEGTNDIWLDDVECTGRESTILKCPHKPLGENNCAHSEDAGVVCSEHVNVLNGSSRCDGRVELYHGGHWKKVCGSDWGVKEAEVLCREVNCGTPLMATNQLQFGQAQKMDNVKTTCHGNETSLAHCAIQEHLTSCVDAVISCGNNKPIRLVNGTNRCSGRVELHHNGEWGTVCDDRWGLNEAQVACREMNCGIPLEVKFGAYFGQGQDQVWMDDVQCSGQEKFLSDCTHRSFGMHDCDHHEDAGVVCSEHLRLTNGTARCNGRLELFHKDNWVKVCNSNWNYQMAKMVCAEIRCGNPKETGKTSHYGQGGLRGYLSRCPANVTSISQCELEPHLGSCEGVSLSCEGTPHIRLVNGTDRCSGRVEIMHNGVWGTVCDDQWDIQDAQVVCRSMDCGSALTAKYGSFFGAGEGEVWLDDVECVGNETSLEHCPRPEFGHNNCGHSEDAGVICSANIRLLNGTDQCSGRVEFFDENQWWAASSRSWGMNEATVVCREMNCGEAKSTSGSFGRGPEVGGYTITCTGRESALHQCSRRDFVSGRIEEATVVCTGNVRLVGGPNECAGRVEFYDKGQWGTLCGEYWDLSDALVVCRQLNCGNPHQITSGLEYGRGSGNAWLKQIMCSNHESSLVQCRHENVPGRTCNASSIAGVICKDSLGVRLVETGRDECRGRVEVRHAGAWQAVCDTEWTLSKAQTVCDVLSCGNALEALGGARFTSGVAVEASEACFQNQTSLQHCTNTGYSTAACGPEHGATVSCAAPLRLVDGPTQCSGRVEIMYKGQWGTVCDDQWALSAGDVVCRQVGCGHAVAAPMSAHFGQGEGPIWLDDVECSGEESALTLCNHPGFGEDNCGHGEDASVICLGGLQKPQISVSPGLEVNWGSTVDVTCTLSTEQLGGTFVLKKTQEPTKEGLKKFSSNDFAVFTFSKVNFNHTGSYYCEFQKKLDQHVINYPQGSPVDLVVHVKLEKPSISLTSPHTMVIYSPEKVSVNKGSSFSITCSIYTKYPDGSFYLTNLKSKVNTSEVKPAFGHSLFYLAYFEFSSIESKDEGSYSCIYALNISSKVYCSPASKSMEVTVVESSSSPVLTSVLVGGVLLVLLLGGGYLLWRRRWRNAASAVHFISTIGGGIKTSADDRGNGALDDSRENEHKQRRLVDDKLDVDGSAERPPEDLAGRVCYELEPLVLS
ncbi:scavenger receptor cysteine-rich type 1 protein M130-like isoform 1-T2 [Synchiropus picturatus]